jgi:hypothetical protein
MHIYDKLFFWVVLAIVGALVVGFTVAHFYDGVTVSLDEVKVQNAFFV